MLFFSSALALLAAAEIAYLDAPEQRDLARLHGPVRLIRVGCESYGYRVEMMLYMRV